MRRVAQRSIETTIRPQMSIKDTDDPIALSTSHLNSFDDLPVSIHIIEFTSDLVSSAAAKFYKRLKPSDGKLVVSPSALPGVSGYPVA